MCYCPLKWELKIKAVYTRGRPSFPPIGGGRIACRTCRNFSRTCRNTCRTCRTFSRTCRTISRTCRTIRRTCRTILGHYRKFWCPLWPNVTPSRTCRTIQSHLSYYLVVLVVRKSYKSRTCRTSGRRFFTRSQFLKSSATSATTSTTTYDHLRLRATESCDYLRPRLVAILVARLSKILDICATFPRSRTFSGDKVRLYSD